MKLPALAAFGLRDFRLLSAAQFISFTALTMQLIVRGWMVMQLTGSPFLVSLVPALHLLPSLLLGFLGGELADRFDRRRVAMWAEVGLLASYASLTVVAFAGVAQAWMVLATTGGIGVAYALTSPARQSLIADAVPDSMQRRAIGAYMLVIHGTLLAAPALAGALLTTSGVNAALAASSALAVAAIPLFLMMRPSESRFAAAREGGVLKSLADGLSYIRRDHALRWMFVALTLVVLLINTWGAMFPVLADEVLNAGAAGLSAITLAVGVGAIVGAILTVSMEGKVSDRWQQLGFGVLFASLIVALAFSGSLAVAVVVTMFASAAGAPFFINNMAATQAGSSSEYRARVVSVRYVVLAIQPIGTLALGLAAEVFGARLALGGSAGIGALLLVAVAVWSARRAGAIANVAEPPVREPKADSLRPAA